MKSPFKTILLLVETSDADIRAAEMAMEMAAGLEAKLVAVSVVEIETLKQLLKSKILIEDEMAELESEMETAGRRQLDYIAGQARNRKIDFEESVARGSLSSAVLDQQQQRSADVVIMGAFTYSMLKRDINLRQKQLIIDQCPCPILLVK